MATMPTRRYSLRRNAFEPHRVRSKNLRDDRVPKTDFCFLTDCNFPQELQDMVWKYLEPHELTSIRATCTTLANSVQIPWMKYTFSEVSIHFTAEHIRNLNDAMTYKPDFAALVKSLRVYSHVRDVNLTRKEGVLLRHDLAAVISKMPQLASVTVVGESFEGSDIYVVSEADLKCNGLNCDLRHILATLHDFPNKVTKFTLERVTARHRLHQGAFEGSVIPDFEDITLLDCSELSFIDQEGPGGYGVPAIFLDQFNTVTTLNFGGHGHLVRGCELARLLNDVRLPALKNLHLSNSTFFENDMLKFCFEHQKTLELIDFKKMTLRAFCFDYLIKDIIKYDNDWASEGPLDMAALKTIRVSQACESWHFDRHNVGEGNEDVHRSILFWGMKDDYGACWEQQVLEVHGRGNPKYDDEYAKFLAKYFEREVLDESMGCGDAYHKCQNLITGFYEEFEGNDAQTMQKFNDGDGVSEYSGEPHEDEVSWWYRYVPIFYDSERED